MNFVGINFKKILIEKEKEIISPFSINSDIIINSINKKKINMIERELLSVNFSFKLSYEPNFAHLLFEGEVILFIEDKKSEEEILSLWKDKKIPEDFNFDLINFIFLKCTIKSLDLEESLGLPIHIPSPIFKKYNDSSNNSSNDTKSYIN